MEESAGSEPRVYFVKDNNQETVEAEVFVNVASIETTNNDHDTTNSQNLSSDRPHINSGRKKEKFRSRKSIFELAAVIGLILAIIGIGLLILLLQRIDMNYLTGNFAETSGDGDKNAMMAETTIVSTATIPTTITSIQNTTISKTSTIDVIPTNTSATDTATTEKITIFQTTPTTTSETSTKTAVWTTTNIETTTIYAGGTWLEPAKSCQDLKLRGIVNDGIYVIKPSADTTAYQVFCDMSTSGGGWTLVGSVHENNIDGKCTTGDKWSSEQGWTKPIQQGKGGKNWRNFNTFGHIESATSADFKSPAYHNLQASDVMVWHVGNDVAINRASEESVLKYHTTDSILSKHGGTLRDLYANISALVLNTTAIDYSEDLVYPRTTAGLSLISRLQNYIPNWHSYVYDATGENEITDGGGDMYDGGNKIFHRAGNESFKQVTYNKSTSFSSEGYFTSSFAVHPFVFLMWIDSWSTSEQFSIKIVSSLGADGTGNFNENSDSVIKETSTLHYHSFQVYGADDDDSSVCGVLFYVEDKVKWNSKSPTSFVKDEWTTGTEDTTHSVIATGQPRSVIMGTSGQQILSSYINDVMNNMLQTIHNADFSAFSTYHYDSVVSPIRFEKGNNDSLKSRVPPKLNTEVVEIGFLQFGAQTNGYDFLALCPGIKIDIPFEAEYVCVGAFRVSHNSSYCGDYTGWAGRDQDVVKYDQPNGYAHSTRDVSSTLLLFTR